MTNDNLINTAKEEAKYLTLLQYLNFTKLKVILDHCLSVQGEIKSGQAFLEENTDGSYDLVLSKDMEPSFKKQTFSELLIVSGISLFEKCCRDWFKWGLKYNPKRIKPFNKKIDLIEIIESNNPKDAIIQKIIDEINFQNVQISNEKFKKVFGITIFENREERYALEKYINHRHIISHNCGYIDFSYIKKTGRTEEHLDKIPSLTDNDLENFTNLIYDIITRIAIKTTLLICKDIN